MGLTVSTLKANVTGTIYTCPSGTVAEVEMVSISSGGSIKLVSSPVSGGAAINIDWFTGGAATLRNSIKPVSADASHVAANNVLAEEATAGNFIFRPIRIRLTPGDKLDYTVTGEKTVTLIIYEQTTGAN